MADCANPGRKIRSKGMGRGLGFGRGKGPIGIPIGVKIEQYEEIIEEEKL